MKKINGISRRDFLKGATAGAIGLAATGLLGCADASNESGAPETTKAPESIQTPETTAPAADTPAVEVPAVEGELPWLGVEPQIADSDVAEEVNVDVVVVGVGLAGVAAVRSAVEEGATVAAFEKGDGPQCRSGEFAVLNGSLQARWGRDNMPVEEIVDHHMDECSYRTKRMIMNRWAKENAEVFDWFIAAKPDLYIAETTRSEIPDESAGAFLIPLFHPLPGNYDYTKEKFPVYPTSVEFLPSQAPVVNANMDVAVAKGAQAFYGHFVEKLIMENGRCVGVYARNAATGKYVKAMAAKGVILATGDYSSNKDILKYYCPETVENNIGCLWMNMDVEGKPTNMGDGLKLGRWVGAAIQQNHAPMTHHMGGGAGADGAGVMGISGYLQLNTRGERFMNEDIPGQQLENQIEMQPGRKTYQFFDSLWPEQLQYFPAGHGVVCYYDESRPKNNETYRNYKSKDQLELAVEQGRAVKADTIEELLSKLDIDQEKAKKSIERYNQLCANGYDEDYGKPSGRLFGLVEGPFYAVEFNPTFMLVCIGGLSSDEECHTFTDEGDVIPGLYVAGNIQGDRMAVQYPISLKGVSHSLALFYGYVAGKNAVNQI